MAGSLKGSPELKARLKAIGKTFQPMGRVWADRTAELTRPSVPSRTGKGRRSVRRKNASTRLASVSAIYYVAILDAGAKAHTIKPRKARMLVFPAGGRTVFARQVHKPQQSGLHFARKAAQRAIRENAFEKTLVDLWNRAA